MFAGDMKLKNFLALVGVGLAGVGGAAWWGISSLPDAEPAAVAPVPVASTVDLNTPVRLAAERAVDIPPLRLPDKTEAPPADVPSGRPVDAAVAAWVGRSLGSSKRKDITSGRPYKVNVYQDEGHTVANRAKVDLDRDEQWDEKWTFHDDGRISRKVAPADDESYTITEVWVEGAWLKQ